MRWNVRTAEWGNSINVIDKLKEKRFDTAPSDFYDKIVVWKSWDDGDVKAFHQYRVFTGKSHVQCRRYSLGMAKKVSEDWAKMGIILLKTACMKTVMGI